MPSALQLAALRREIREAISAGLVDAPDARERLTARLDRLGKTGGRPALTVLASLTLNGMLELQKARTGVQLGGIADFLRTSVDRFGQPQAAIGRGLVEAIRHGYSAGSLDAPKSKKALDQVWASFGPESLGYGATLIVLLYREIALARETRLPETWAVAAARDAREVDQQPSTPP